MSLSPYTAVLLASYGGPDRSDDVLPFMRNATAGKGIPDEWLVEGPLAAFALGDYEWPLAFEADELTSLVDAMHHQRGVEARLHVREKTPFFTGQRVELAEWIERQPRA